VGIKQNGNNISAIQPAPAPARTRQAEEEEPDSIREMLETVWRQRALLAVSIGVALLGGVLYLLVATRYYSAYAKLFVRQSGPAIMREQSPRNLQDDTTFLFTQREMINSTPVIAMVLGRPGIRELRTFDGEDNTFAFFKNHLTIEVGKKDDLISLQFDTPYRDEAQKIISALIDSYTEYQSQQRHASSSEVLSVLQQEREKRGAELGRKQDELHAYRATHAVIAGADSRTNVVRQRLEKISEALTSALLETSAAKTALDDVSRSILSDPLRQEAFEQYRASAVFQAPSSADDAQLRAEMLQWQAYKQGLSGRYLANHPRMREAQTKVDQLNLLYAAAVYRRYETARQKEADLQAEFDRQQKLAVEYNAHALTDTRLAREVELLAASTEELDGRIRDVTVTQGGAAPKITVVEPPSVSKSPTRPYTARTLAMALLAGLVVGGGLACVRDLYDHRLHSADAIRASLGVTVLGLIPHVDDETSPIARGQKIHIDPSSETAEAYRSLRTAIYFGGRDALGGASGGGASGGGASGGGERSPVQTILITSPERDDGKTTLASNLAISLAQAGRRTLIIDADMRAAMQDLIFSLNGRIGLANVLADKETAQKVIRQTGIANLDLLPAGTASRNPSELLNSEAFHGLLEQLAEAYDHVVIDSPPLLAVTDARIIAASADATLLVLRAGKSNRKLSELSIDALVSVGAKLLGAAVNDVHRRAYPSYGSYGRYEYGAEARAHRGALEGDVVSRNGEGGAGGRIDEYAATGNGNGIDSSLR
jgi:capsular exopolysaccharide synthesis family protein